MIRSSLSTPSLSGKLIRALLDTRERLKHDCFLIIRANKLKFFASKRVAPEECYAARVLGKVIHIWLLSPLYFFSEESCLYPHVERKKLSCGNQSHKEPQGTTSDRVTRSEESIDLFDECGSLVIWSKRAGWLQILILDQSVRYHDVMIRGNCFHLPVCACMLMLYNYTRPSGHDISSA